MKQSVAPESTSAFVSAITLIVLIETGTCIDRNCVVTITELNLWTALTQADGFRRSENPPFLQGLSSPVLVCLLLLLLLLGAMSRLAVEGFEWLIMPLLVVLLLPRMCFCRQLLLHVLGSDVGSSCVAFHCCLIGSTCAEGSCDSDVPFYGMCNTQLRVGLSSSLLRVLFVGILLEGYTLRVAWSRGLFLHFLRHVLLSFLWMYPSHLGLRAFVVASIPSVARWLLLLGVLSVVPSCGCNLAAS